MLAAMAFVIRPNVVLFFPALVAAATTGNVSTFGAEAEDGSSTALKRTMLAALEWIGVFGGMTLVLFAPLLLSGLMNDLIQGLRILRPGGPYSDASSARSIGILWKELSEFRTWALLISLLALAAGCPDRAMKMMARTWLVALAAGLVYRPIHPQDHAYLKTPLTLVEAVAWAIPIAWVIRVVTGSHRVRLAGLPAVVVILLIVYETMPEYYPRNCNVRASIDSVHAAVRGGWPEVPPGARSWYTTGRSLYRWDDYCRVLKYVRENTGPKTILANVLREPPFPAVNGPTGRRSPFRVESGVAWMEVVAEDLDETFARQLERLGLTRSSSGRPLKSRMHPACHYSDSRPSSPNATPRVRFGRFEVWRRK